MLTPLQLPSDHHNPYCDRCARDAEDKVIKCEKRVWSRNSSQGKVERHPHLSTKQRNKKIQAVHHKPHETMKKAL